MGSGKSLNFGSCSRQGGFCLKSLVVSEATAREMRFLSSYQSKLSSSCALREQVYLCSSQDFRSQNLSDEELAQAIIDVKQLFQLRLQKPPGN